MDTDDIYYAIMTQQNGINIVIFPCVSASFEVTINGKLVFSKLQLRGFPKEEDVSEDYFRCHEI